MPSTDVCRLTRPTVPCLTTSLTVLTSSRSAPDLCVVTCPCNFSLLETVRLIHVFLKVSRVIEGEWEAESCTALKLALGCSSASAPR